MSNETNKQRKLQFLKFLNREYTVDEFKLAVYLMLFFCILAFSAVGQIILIGFAKVVAVFSGVVTLGIGVLRHFQKEKEEDDIFDVDCIEDSDEEVEVWTSELDEVVIAEETTAEESTTETAENSENSEEQTNPVIEADPIYLFDKSGLQDLAEYFKGVGIKYWEVAKGECITRMPSNVASVAYAMKKKLCYVPASVVEDLIANPQETAEVQAQSEDTEKQENSPKKCSHKALPDEYKFIINHFVMIGESKLPKEEQKSKGNEKKARKKKVPELIRYASFLTETQQRKIQLITQNEELKDFMDDKISVLTLSEVA